MIKKEELENKSLKKEEKQEDQKYQTLDKNGIYYCFKNEVEILRDGVFFSEQDIKNGMFSQREIDSLLRDKRIKKV